jgi:hypothetical protein
MQTHPSQRPASELPAGNARTTRSDASIRDSVRILAETVIHLAERVELLEARAALHRAH